MLHIERTIIEKLHDVVMVNIKKLRQIKNDNPALKSGFYIHPGSILNAYREGDLSFEEAVEALNEWKNHEN